MDKLLWHIEKRLFATLISYDWAGHHIGDKTLYYIALLSDGTLIKEPDFKFYMYKEIIANGNKLQ